jgi:hypothetical protein
LKENLSLIPQEFLERIPFLQWNSDWFSTLPSVVCSQHSRQKDSFTHKLDYSYSESSYSSPFIHYKTLYNILHNCIGHAPCGYHFPICWLHISYNSFLAAL